MLDLLIINKTFFFQCNEHIYYRWRLFSILQGDRIETWREEPFAMYLSCPVWVPPTPLQAQNLEVSYF